MSCSAAIPRSATCRAGCAGSAVPARPAPWAGRAPDRERLSRGLGAQSEGGRACSSIGGTYAGAYLLEARPFMPWELSERSDADLVAPGLSRLAPLRRSTARCHRVPAPRSPASRRSMLRSTCAISCCAIPTGRAWRIRSKYGCRWSTASCFIAWRRSRPGSSRAKASGCLPPRPRSRCRRPSSTGRRLGSRRRSAVDGPMRR